MNIRGLALFTSVAVLSEGLWQWILSNGASRGVHEQPEGFHWRACHMIAEIFMARGSRKDILRHWYYHQSTIISLKMSADCQVKEGTEKILRYTNNDKS